jgi:thiol:disulfide interchange protein DsbD
VSRREDGLEILLKKALEAPGARSSSAPATLDGVLAMRGEDGAERVFEISANPVSAAPAESSVAWWEALMLAFLGGIVLNVMPCVFPILSLKLLGLAKQAHGGRSQQLGHGLAYTAGVLATFAALGGALLALRAGGQAVGWGFQLQSPIFVAVLAYLLFAMGLSLSGVVAFGTSFADAGGRIAGRSGLAGTFFTGVLATTVATPCTAPFMGAALACNVRPRGSGDRCFSLSGSASPRPISPRRSVPAGSASYPSRAPGWILSNSSSPSRSMAPSRGSSGC